MKYGGNSPKAVPKPQKNASNLTFHKIFQNEIGPVSNSKSLRIVSLSFDMNDVVVVVVVVGGQTISFG